MCPLCWRFFSRDAITSGEITLEHIIPLSIGGRLTTLTCKTCNNVSGTLLDAHLVERLHAEDVSAGRRTGSIPMRVTIESAEFGAEVSWPSASDPEMRIIGLPQQSDPRMLKLAFAEIDAGVKEFTITGRFRYKNLPSQIAFLRSAYLLMFRYFGYCVTAQPSFARS